jgi:hypothetical protein
MLAFWLDGPTWRFNVVTAVVIVSFVGLLDVLAYVFIG